MLLIFVKKKRNDEEKSELFEVVWLWIMFGTELNLNINAHGLSSSFSVIRDKNKKRQIHVSKSHTRGKVVTREKKKCFLFGESRQLYRFSRFFSSSSQGFKALLIFFSCEKLWKNFLRPWLTQLFCYYLKFFFYFHFLLTRCCPAGKWKENILDCLWDIFFSFLCDQNTYKTLMSSDVLGCMPTKYWY